MFNVAYGTKLDELAFANMSKIFTVSHASLRTVTTFMLLALAASDLAASAHATMAYDPPPNGVALEGISLPAAFIFDEGNSKSAPGGKGEWIEVFKEAMREWDDILCYQTDLTWGSGGYKVIWEDNNFFVNTYGKYGFNGTDADTYGVTDFKRKTIYFKTNIFDDEENWSFSLGSPGEKLYSFKAIAKHEIGHALGLVGDWGQLPPGENPPPGASSIDVMWGVFDQGMDFSLTRNDIIALKKLYPQAHARVPGPLPLFGVAAAFGYSRKLRKRIKDSELLQLVSAID